MTQDFRLKFLRTQPLLSGFNDEQIRFLSQSVEEISYKPDEYIIREQELSKDIYFVLSGICEVSKTNPSGEIYVIDQIQEGGVFGEVAFIDSKPRSSSVKAKTVAVLLKLSFDLFKFKHQFNGISIDSSSMNFIFDQLYENIVKESFSRLRKTNEKFITSIKERVQRVELQNDFGAFFVFIITFFSTYNLILSVFSAKEIFKRPILLVLSSVILLGTNIFFLYKRDISLESIGFTWKGGAKSLLESLVLIFFGFLSVGAFYSYFTGSWDLFFSKLDVQFLKFLTYKSLPIIFYVFTIEFVMRGVILTSLRRFLADVSGFRSIVISSFFLFPVNLQQGFDILVIKFYIDLVLGFIYLKQQNLIGVVLIHYIIIQMMGFYS